MKRPRIAITGPRRGAFGPRFLVARAIRYYGGVPVQLGPGDERRLPRYDGVVVTAGPLVTAPLSFGSFLVRLGVVFPDLGLFFRKTFSICAGLGTAARRPPPRRRRPHNLKILEMENFWLQKF